MFMRFFISLDDSVHIIKNEMELLDIMLK